MVKFFFLILLSLSIFSCSDGDNPTIVDSNVSSDSISTTKELSSGIDNTSSSVGSNQDNGISEQANTSSTNTIINTNSSTKASSSSDQQVQVTFTPSLNIMFNNVEPCVAKFTEEYLVKAPVGGDSLFTIQVDEELIISYRLSFSSNKVELFYINENGVFNFLVSEKTYGQKDFPFVSNCTEADSTDFMGIFADVTIYADTLLTKEACSLTKGTAMETRFFGQGPVNGWEGSSLVYINKNSLIESECGISTGYIMVDETEVFPGYWNWVMPIEKFLGKPKSN